MIVLVITIIVIIILATAVIVTISSNNPIDEANRARYESDRDSMQALFTNTVAKIMAKTLGTVNVTAGQINSVTNEVSETTGEVAYTVTDAVNIESASGTIVFDKGENTDTVFYTGKQLPIYASGETKWYVDAEGDISLEVAGVKYGKGEITFAPGAYDANNVMLASWDELVNDYGLDIQVDYTYSTYNTSSSSMYSVLNNNEELSSTTKVIIGNDVTKIGKWTFSYCTGLTTIIIPDSVTSIGGYVFSNCSGLTSITIPNSVTSIGTYAFERTGLTSIGPVGSGASLEIPDSVTSIGTYAFFNCISLTSVTIGNSVTSIGDSAFGGCSGLNEIIVGENNTKYDSRDNSNCIIETAINTLIRGCNNSTIPDSVTSIGGYVFSSCSGLTSITIPKSVTSINGYAFAGCTNLTTIYYKGTATGAPWGATNATVVSE